MYYTEAGKLRSVPTSWTSVADEDDFQRASAGRSWFRLDDLLALSALVITVKQLRRKRVK